MFERVRQLRISLAVKSQLLFGGAVVLIIGTALIVPWQRMEQLTQQLNDRAATAVVETVLSQHIQQMHRAPTRVAAHFDAEPPATQSLEPAVASGQYQPPRLLWINRLQDDPESLSAFEKRAISRFVADPNRPIYWRDYDRGTGLLYAQAVAATPRCITCHASTPPAVAEPLSNSAPPSTQVALAQLAARDPPIIGLVSLDMPSQISANQLLLNRVLLLTAAAIPAFLAWLIFSLIVSRLILRPVRVLQETAEKVAEGDLNIRSDISSGDEFQQLSETFNTMLINLKNSADQLRAVNKSLDLRLGQLAESNVALYESNRLKSEFLANVSHELRTPLNSILGFADLLRDLAATEADAKMMRYVQNILRSGNHLLDLINDLLDLAKIEAGRMEVRAEPLSIVDVFEGLVSLLKPLSEQKQLRVSPHVDSDVPILQTDPAKLQQILYNFLSNAIKFSPAGEMIDLRAEREGEGVRISVTDRGPGIEPEKQPVIFEKFRQLDGSVTREHGGTGLGLAISRELATLLGGSIGVRSAPGEGATFHITLPLRIEAGQQDVRSTLVLT